MQQYQAIIARWAVIAASQSSETEVNVILARLGMPPITVASPRARYVAKIQVNLEASIRDGKAEARTKVADWIRLNDEAGSLNHYADWAGHQSVPGTLEWSSPDGTWMSDTEYMASDGEASAPLNVTVDELRELVRAETRSLAMAKSWTCTRMASAWKDLGLGEWPRRGTRYAKVPVTGYIKVGVEVFPDATAAEANQAALKKATNYYDAIAPVADATAVWCDESEYEDGVEPAF